MLVVKEGECLNLANVLSFFKAETEAKKEGIFKKAPDSSEIKYFIEFYFSQSIMRKAKMVYHTEEARDRDFNKIVEGYNLNYRLVDL